MESKVCPICNKLSDCRVIDDSGPLNWVWECSICNSHFEKPTVFKKVMMPGIALVGLFFGISSRNNNP